MRIRLEEIIINEGYSPAAALAKAKEEGIDFTVCVTTLYSYIDKGVFYNLTLKTCRKSARGKRNIKEKRHKRGQPKGKASKTDRKK